jgi:predicted transcriptional regulator of viral defense system
MKVEVSSTNATLLYTPALSQREASLLAQWELARVPSVTIADIRRLVGAKAAKGVAWSLARKNVLQRVGRGIYLVRPLRSLVGPSMSSAIVSVATLLRDEPYYLGGLWAFTHHRLTTQQYLSRLDVFVIRRRPPRELGSAKVVFHVLEPDLLAYGIARSTIEGIDVHVSDIERTLLDVLDHPALAGGFRGALAFFQETLPRADLRKLIDHASRGSRASTCQRVGVLLERQQISLRALSPLRQRIAETRSRSAMLPNEPMKGRFNQSWRVVENDR